MKIQGGWAKIAVTLCCLLAAVLMCGCALAEEGVIAEADRTDVDVLSGLKFVQGKEPAYDSATGVWSMTIDTAATDWDQVVGAGYMESKEVSGLSLLIRQDASKKVKFLPYFTSTNYLTAQEEQEWLEENQKRMNPVPAPGSGVAPASYGLKIGSYDASIGKFFPRESTPEEGRIVFARFAYQDDTFDSRYIKAVVSFSSLNPVDVKLDKVPAENIIPNFGGTNVDVTVADGFVSYSNPTDNPQEMTLITAVKAPGTAQETANWSAYIGDRQQKLVEDANGHKVVRLYTDLPAKAAAVSSADVILWKDKQQNLMASQEISIKAVHGNPRPWPEYVNTLTPFGKSDMRLKVQGGVSGVSVETEAETAIVRLAIDSKKVISAAAKGDKLTDAKLEVSLKVPKDAAYYTGGDTVTAGTNIYGTELADRYLLGLGGGALSETPEAINSSWITLRPTSYFEELSFRDLTGGETKYYLAEGRSFATPLGGSVQIISWYDAQMNLLSKNYLIYTFDDAALVTTQKALDDESELSGSADEPRVIIEGNWHKGHGEVSLKAERMPSSPQSHYYNMQLVGEDGAVIPVPSGEKCIVYLPYPEGYNRETAQNLVLTIGHYNSQMQLQEEAFSVANGNLELTPHGMRLRVSGFSPFVVNWTEAAPTPTPTTETTPSPTSTVEATPSPTPTAEATPSPTPTVEATPSPTPTAEATPTPTPEPTAEPAPTAPPASRVEKLPLSNEHLSAELKAAGIKNVADVEIRIRTELLKEGISIPNCALYEIQLQYWENGEWVLADSQHFPRDAHGKPWLHVLMDLPEGSDPSCIFTVAHMFSTSDFGNTPGEVEYPAVEVVYVNGKPMLSFHVRGLSPVMVVWKELAPVPATGDSFPLNAVWLCGLLALAGIGWMTRRMRRA